MASRFVPLLALLCACKPTPGDTDSDSTTGASTFGADAQDFLVRGDLPVTLVP